MSPARAPFYVGREFGAWNAAEDRQHTVIYEVATRTIDDQEPWHEVGAAGEPAFEEGWTNRDPDGWPMPTIAFKKSERGIVFLRGSGRQDNTVTNSIIFTLPEGSRPEFWHDHTLTLEYTAGTLTVIWVRIQPVGHVQVLGTLTGPVGDPAFAPSFGLPLDGIAFFAA